MIVLRPGLAPRVGRVFRFLVSFAVAKGVVVVAPLLLAGLIARDAYGAFEWSISMGQLGAILFSCFVTAAMPVLMLKRNGLWLSDVKALGHGAIALGCGLVALVLLLAGKPVAAVAACAVSFISTQQIATTYAQARGRRQSGLLWSSVATIAMVALFALGRGDLAATGWLSLAGVATIVLLAGLDFRRSLRPELGARRRRALVTGAPLVGYVLVAVWLAASGRIFIGFWLGLGEVGAYGLGFRLASLLLLPHAIFTAAFFVRLFQMRARAFDRFASFYLVITAVGAFALALAVAFALPRWGALWFTVDVLAVADIFPLLAIHVLFWIATATLSSRVSRLKLGFPATLGAGLAGLVGAAAVMGLAAAGMASLKALCLVVAMQEGLHLVAQIVALRRRKMVFPRLLGAVALGVVPLAALAVWV